jgi:transglutaminase-like putative cysteine protease
MSGRGRLALCAAVATLAAACALLPLVTPVTWLLQTALLVGAQTLVGAAARRVPLAGPLTVAVQAVVSLLLLTALFAGGTAVAGVLPGPDALAEFGRLLSEGGRDVGQFATPAPLTDGIRLMLVGGVLLVGLLVDAMAVTYRSAAPAGLPLLALYSIAAGLLHGGLRWLWFLCAACGYLLLLLAEGRERLSQWGRVFGDQGRPGAHTPDGAARGHAAPVRTGRRIGALTLGIALLVPAALPSLSGGPLSPGRGGGAGQGGGDGTISAVNPAVGLQDSLNQPADRTALTYRTTAASTQDMYLRIVALDQFDGSEWKPSERRIDAVPDPLPSPPGLAPGVRTQTVRSSISAAGWYAQNWLPMPYPAGRVRIGGRWRFEPEGRTLVGDRGQTTRGERYQVQSLIVEPTARQLDRAPAPPAALKREYTKVPASLPSVVRRTAQGVTDGAKNDYQRAVRLQNWFALDGGFTYNTRVRAGGGSTAIADFLKQKEGFCVHFAFTMAAMARTLGIPARVAVGFTPGAPRSDGRMKVGLKDAHAWPELYFQGVGWTRFEPTPTRGSTPSYTQPDAPEVSRNPSERLPGQRQRTAPVSTPTPSQSCGGEDRDSGGGKGVGGDREGCGETAAPSHDGGSSAGRNAAMAVGALALLSLPLLPMLWRLRRRAQRLGTRGARGRPGGEPPGSDAAVMAAWRELIDTGWDYGVVPEESATPRRAAERIVGIGDLDPGDPEAAAAARRMALAVERVLYAPRPEPYAGAVADVVRVRRALRAAAPRGLRVRALLLPPSSRQVLWGASRRWAAVRERWRGTLRERLAR